MRYKCFFISPFGEAHSLERQRSDLLEKMLIIPVLNMFPDFDSESLRSDEMPSPTITDEMLRRLRDDELCIADLTGKNPNVYWEYGYRYANGKPIIAIADESTEIPFDIRDVNVIRFPMMTTLREMTEGFMPNQDLLQKKLRERIQYYLDRNFKVEPVVTYEWMKTVESKLLSLHKKLDLLINSSVLIPKEETNIEKGNDPEAIQVSDKIELF